MEKSKFQWYCEKVSAMEKEYQDWYARPSSIIRDCLRESTVYVQVLERLLVSAYKIVKEYVKKRKIYSDNGDLYELTSQLFCATNIDDCSFCFSACCFAICVVLTCFFNVSIDDSVYELFDENELIKFDCSETVQEELDPQEKELKKFSLRLLDFSRTNQLVHFRPIKSAAMSLLSGNVFATLLQLNKKDSRMYISGWKKLNPEMVYKCKICGRVEFHRYEFGAKINQPSKECPECDANNTHNRKSMVPLKEKLVCLPNDGYYCSCGKKLNVAQLKKHSLVCPKCGENVDIEFSPIINRRNLTPYEAGEMVSVTGDTATKDIAKTLLNKAKNMERNFGLHVLYLACGFLKWKDTNGKEYNSPILLCPINLGIDKSNGQYYFEVDKSVDEIFDVNKTLLQMLAAYSKTVSITLPPLDKNIGEYFSLIRQSFQNSMPDICEITKNWEIDNGFGIGLFHYQKLQLQHDIEVNQEKYLQNPIIRRLCGDEDAEIAQSVIQKGKLKKYVMLDADSSQEDVINASLEGKSFILQGPPGSGKSQTITNIISSVLGEGKTVLFVTEKTSARSIIIDKLLKCNVGGDKKLTDFVLDFDSFKKRGGSVSRNSFIAEINGCLTKYTPVGGYDDQILADEALRREQLEKFMLQMRGEYNGRNYLRLLRDMAPYSSFNELNEVKSIPTDSIEFAELCASISEYCSSVKNHRDMFDYSNHPLCGCKGDLGNDLVEIASEYKKVCDTITDAVSVLTNNYGWHVDYSLETLQRGVAQIRSWSEMPRLSEEILKNISKEKVATLLGRAKKRKETIRELGQHRGKNYSRAINGGKFSSFNLYRAKEQSNTYSSFFKRIGKKYHTWKEGIFDCFKTIPNKRNYKSAVIALQQLQQYGEYLVLKTYNEEQKAKDLEAFGFDLVIENWDELIKALNTTQSIISKCDRQVLGLEQMKNWALCFVPSQYSITINQLKTLEQQLLKVSEEQILRKRLSAYVETSCTEFFSYRSLAENVIKHQSTLSVWYHLNIALEKITLKGWRPILDELIESNENDFEKAKARLFRSYYQKMIREFVGKNGLDYMRDFTREDHEERIASYAKADKRMLSTGARRLYESLHTYLEKSALDKSRGVSGEYPKLQSKTNCSIKQTIYENWDYIKHIKPCLMMSPLNVSQYIDVAVQFDLVIFDEASQIFTEDALASIVRGKQVIIAGDSKQLPPCDFFRAGESILDDDDQYFQEEINIEKSLLSAADKVLSDASIALTWHYRSCDEALIAFSNKEMEYKLTSFPSATRNPNDGIYYVSVDYSTETCYVAGKGGTHINSGEAVRIVELIYSEMTHSECGQFSIGVVAFSNAQAFEIETQWEEYKRQPDRKATIEQWEKLHEAEPLIFCNLDTVQGDERDTTIISICYSPDEKEKFSLPYLGRVRLLSGMKRINVAITRAKHRMIVVSTLKSNDLKAAIHSSSAPDENKAGAQMLCNFLEYAQSFTGVMEVACGASDNPFVADICRVLDENGIDYNTEIGRSECKINIGICKAGKKGDFVLGIIVDDPSRTDFDSAREYARLTEQVLCQKYGWNIYRVYPIAWINDYEYEKQCLLDAIRIAKTAKVNANNP